jgi:peptidoglycan L-alanyl-D-glutamate endopeptidase CwlK
MSAVDPHDLLAQVHPDLAKVINAAAQAPIRFQVVYGLRTAAAEAGAVASGHSTTMHSRHLADARYDGQSCAVDICVVDANGQLDWTVATPLGGAFGAAAEQIQDAADKLGIPIEWGGAAVGAWTPGVVSTFHDWGHYQLPWAQYP